MSLRLQEGGIRPGDKQFFAEIRKICDETGAVMIMDEVRNSPVCLVGSLASNPCQQNNNLFAYVCMYVCMYVGADGYGADRKDVGI